MAVSCLYLDIRESGVTAGLGDARESVRFPEGGGGPDADAAPAGPIPGFGEALGLLAEQMDLSGCGRAVVLLPPAWISFRRTDLPFTQEKKIRQVLPMEIAPCLPDPNEPVLTDFILPQGSAGVFSATLAEEKMAAVYDGLASLGISPVLAVPRGVSQAMAFQTREKETAGFLHVNAAGREITLTLVAAGRPAMVRMVGGLVWDSGGSATDGKRLARECLRTVAAAGLSAGIPVRDLAEMPMVIQGLDNDGAGQFRKALPDHAAARFLTPDPFPEVLTPDSRIPFLFNFCIGPYKSDSFAARYRRPMAVCLVLALLAFGLHLAGLYRQSNALEAQVNQVRQASLAVYAETFPQAGQSPAAAPLMRMESKIKQAKQRRGEAKGGDTALATVRVTDLLADLSGRIPPGVDMEISRLALNHGRLVLTGSTGNFNDVDRIKGLIRSAGFKSVTINSAEADKTGNRVRFKFVVEI